MNRVSFSIQADLKELDDNVLSGTGRIGNTCLHVELIEVDEEGDAVNCGYQNRIDAVKDFDDGHGTTYESVMIGRRRYFAIVHPFQA